MAAVKHTTTEYDWVELLEPEGQWPAGTDGTVVIDHGDIKMVEIADPDIDGATLDLIQVPQSQLRVITDPNRHPKGYGKLPLYGD